MSSVMHIEYLECLQSRRLFVSAMEIILPSGLHLKTDLIRASLGGERGPFCPKQNEINLNNCKAQQSSFQGTVFVTVLFCSSSYKDSGQHP